MAYAIVKTGGKQYRVEEGQTLLVERLPDEAGATVELTPLLLAGDGDPVFDADKLSGSPVRAEIVGHERGKKLRVFKFKPKRGYRRTTGFRSALTQIEIESIGAEKKRSRAKAEKPAEVEATAAEATAVEAAPDETPKPARKPRAKKTTEEGSD